MKQREREETETPACVARRKQWRSNHRTQRVRRRVSSAERHSSRDAAEECVHSTSAKTQKWSEILRRICCKSPTIFVIPQAGFLRQSAEVERDRVVPCLSTDSQVPDGWATS
jgi:hypothetical protein